MILTNSNAAKVGGINVNAIASSTASFRQFMCYVSTTISAAISGTTGLIKNGIGGLTLSGVCNYTGPTQINAGQDKLMDEEIIDTSGFYKNENGNLLFGPNFVLNSNYELRKETHDQHNYPVDGWFWFDNEDQAKLHLINNY